VKLFRERPATTSGKSQKQREPDRYRAAGKPSSFLRVRFASRRRLPEAPFVVGKSTYPTAEHFMMAEKARLFGDEETARLALEAPHPGAAKEAGRQVKGFVESVWQERRFGIVVEANQAKFSQNPELRDFLLATTARVLVEASPTDRIWGIGLAADDAHASNPHEWRGLNLLGFALMAARARIAEP
jgi:ribA/ribD-fused uncharacterized protein